MSVIFVDVHAKSSIVLNNFSIFIHGPKLIRIFMVAWNAIRTPIITLVVVFIVKASRLKNLSTISKMKILILVTRIALLY